jgi:hypothetical protein
MPALRPTASFSAPIGEPCTKMQSVIPWRTTKPSSSAVSFAPTRTSRACRVIASCTSTRPNLAFLYPVYPKQVTSIHLRTESMPAIAGSARFASFVPIRISRSGRRHPARKPGRLWCSIVSGERLCFTMIEG